MSAVALCGVAGQSNAAPQPRPSAPALTEAQILDITCSGARVTQSGLPPGDRFRVVVSDPAPTTRELASATARSDPVGSIDVHLTFARGSVARLHVEVEDLDRGAEYGETGTDLSTRCPGRWTDSGWLRLGAPAAVAVLVSVGVVLLRRRRFR